MRAALLDVGATSVTVRSIPIPELRRGAVRVRLRKAFFAPFQLRLIDGTSGFSTPPRPFAPGMDGVGVIDAIGDGVSGLSVGDRVYCDCYYESPDLGRSQDHCFLGNFAIGPKSEKNLAEWPAGSFAEMALMPAECLIPIGGGIGYGDAILVRLGWLGTAYAALRKVGFKAGDSVAVNGATGILGSSAVLIALAMGARRVLALGRRKEVLKEIAGLDPRVETSTSSLAGENFDIAFTSIEGTDPSSIQDMMTGLRRRGALVVVSSVSQPLSLPLGWLFVGDMTVRGSLWFERQDIAEILNMVRSGVLKLDPVRALEFPLSQIDRAAAAVTQKRSGLEQVVIQCDQ